MTPAPQIREFRANADADSALLCYQVSNADSLTLSPRPGELAGTGASCIRVDLGAATTFTLTARNAKHTARQSLTVKPLAAQTAKPAQEKAAAPSTAQSPAKPAASSRLPLAGESWRYRSAGKWPTSPKRKFQIVVKSVANGVVTDVMRSVEPGKAAGESVQSRGASPQFIAWRDVGLEFSPYLAAYADVAGLQSQDGFPAPALETQWTDWHSQFKPLGRETVTVPAGSFDAYKIEVWSNRHATGGSTLARMEPVSMHFVVWYAPQAKRYVKMRRQVVSATGNELEEDVIELEAQLPP